jgi:hypothetical protein
VIAGQAAVGIGRACMGVVFTCRAVKVLPVAVCIVIRLEAFVAGPRLDQRVVDGEVLIRQQWRDVFVLQQRLHEVIEQIALLQSFSMLGTRRCVSPHVVWRKPIHQLPFAPHTVKQLLSTLQQLFGRDRRAPCH